MSSNREQRRLSAILAADVAGYTRLVEQDAEGTVAAWRTARAEVIQPAVSEHGGRIVKLTGDSFLAEFPTVQDGVRCAIAMQERLADGPLEFRMAVNLGDVIDDGEDIHGEGVNIAARIEAFADPGGICVSGGVYDQVRNQLDSDFEDMGEHEVKHVSAPVRVFRVVIGERGATPISLALPDKPSIAVLPFDNISGDPGQDYLSAGISEDIITALSKFRWFFVSARNSAFAYKSEALDIQRIGRELGVRYVLKGSVRKAGDHIRVSAQLIEAESGNHIWAERYDRVLEDILDLQEEITLTISGTVAPELASSERNRSIRKASGSIEAWDLYQRGMAKIWMFDTEPMGEGADLLRRAITLDPEFADAYANLAYTNFWDASQSRRGDREENIRTGMANARSALAIDSQNFVAHMALGRLLNLRGENRAAKRELEASIKLNPSFAQAYIGLAIVDVFLGEPQEAIRHADMGIRLSPNDPLLWTGMSHKAHALTMLGQLDDAIELQEEVARFANIQFLPVSMLAAFCLAANQEEKAQKAWDFAQSLSPGFRVAQVENYFAGAEHDFFAPYIERLRRFEEA